MKRHSLAGLFALVVTAAFDHPTFVVAMGVDAAQDLAS